MPIERIPAIIGVGSALPRRRVRTEDVKTLFPGDDADSEKSRRMVGIFARIAGIDERRWVTPGKQATSDLGAIALRRAARMAKIDLSDLTSVVLATSSPDYIGVPASALIQYKLGMLDQGVRFYDVGGNACVGLLQALHNVIVDVSNKDYGSGGPQAALGVEVLSGTLPGAAPDVAAIFGDGGSAMIIDMVTPDLGAPTKIVFAFETDGSHIEDLYVPGGGSVNFTNARTVEKNMHVVRMNGPVIKDDAIRLMSKLGQRVMDETDYTPQNAILIPHQANKKIMEGVAGELGFSEDQVVSTIGHTGNTSAASIGIALAEGIANGRVNRNDRILAITFGGGENAIAATLPSFGFPKRRRRSVYLE